MSFDVAGHDMPSSDGKRKGSVSEGIGYLSPYFKTVRRRTSSAVTYGLVKSAISDHVPIRFDSKSKAKTHIISWNLLADPHLYNYFRNITGRKELLKHLSDENLYKSQGKLFHFLSELAQFLYKYCEKDGEITITEESLENFISGKPIARYQDSKLCGGNITEQAILTARQEIIKVIFSQDNTEETKHEYRNLISHCMELIYHIQHEDGVLRWKNRIAMLRNNTKLMDELHTADFLCFQECTNPKDMLAILSDRKMRRMLTHNINGVDDHCVLIYDELKFTLVEGFPVVKYDLVGKKPCILARFKNNATDEEFIMASIHYPGGHDNPEIMKKLIGQLVPLRKANEKISIYLVGDFNNSTGTIQVPKGFQLCHPTKGTTGAHEYGNVGKAVDAALTNHSENVDITLLEHIATAFPAHTPLTYKFADCLKKGNRNVEVKLKS